MQARKLSEDAERFREAGGVTVSTTIHDRGGVLPRHVHERPYFCYVVEGRFEERSGYGVHRCSIGTLVYHPAGDAHADEFAAATRCLNIEFPVGWEQPHIASLRQRHQQSDLRLSGLAQRLGTELMRDDEASSLAIQGLALELAAEWSRVTTQRAVMPQWLENAAAILRSEYRGDVEVRDVAERVGIHPVQLSRMFHRMFRVTMTEYVARLRVQFALRQLAGTDEPLSAIALDSGFADQSHFCKVFRRYVGTTPNRYRKSVDANGRQKRT